jgi:nucleoside-triphosphatase THEP1
MPRRQPVIVVTGPSGAGKSTLCRTVMQAAVARSLAVGGVSTAPRTPDRRRTGLDVVNVVTGERLPLAEWERPTGGPSTGGWHFHQPGLDAGLAWCASVPPGALLLVDELGPLELRQGLGWAPLVDRMRDHDGPAIAVVRPALVETFAGALQGRPIVAVDVDAAARESALAAVGTALGWPA